MTTVQPDPSVSSPEISVVIPTRNRRDSVVAVVEALLADDVATSEVVVVDDGGTDGTTEALQALAQGDERVVAVRQEHGGKRVANANAMARARGRVLLFLDDDVLPAPGLLRGHLDAHRTRDDQVVVGYMPTTVPEPATGSSFATILYAQEYEGRCRIYESDPSDVLQHLWMGNVSLTRAGYDRAGLLHMPAYAYRHEDRETGLRCAAAGLVGVFDRRLRATHRHSRTVDQYLRDCWLEGAGQAELSLRHPDSAALAAESYARGLPFPVGALVAACTREDVRRPVLSLLVPLLRLTTRGSRPGPALAVARLVRRIVLQQGFLDRLQREGDRAPAPV
jgi:GT2 family glycosyltransferase